MRRLNPLTDREQGVDGRRGPLVLLGILLCAVALRLPSIHGNLPDIYWHDELNFIEGALRVGTGEIRGASFGGYSHGTLTYFLLFAVFGVWFVLGRLTGVFSSVNSFVLDYVTDPSRFILLVHAVMLAASVATVAMTYIVGKRLFGSKAGLFASCLMAASFQSVHMTYGKEDGLFTLLMVVTFLLVIRAVDQPQRGVRYVLAGGGLAAAAAVKYFGFVGFALLVGAALVGAWPDWRQAVKNFSLSLAGFLGAFICFMPAVVLDPGRLLGSFFALREGNAGILMEAPSGGGAWYGYIWTTYAVAGGVVLAGLYYAGAALLVRERKPKGLLLLIYPAVLTLALTGVLLFGKGVEVPYYQLSTIPFLCIAAGRLLAWMSESSARLKWVAWGLLLAATAGNVADGLRFHRLEQSEDSRTVARKWMEASVPSGASVLTEGAILTFILEAPQLKETRAALERDLRQDRVRGGSGRMVQAKLQALERDRQPIPRYDLHKVYNLTPRDLEAEDYDYVIARSEQGRRVIESSGAAHRLVFSIQPPAPRLFQIVPVLSVDDMTMLWTIPILSQRNPPLTPGPAIWVYQVKPQVDGAGVGQE